ncbi:MAG: 2'-5' RNA ligase family protein [Gammaproteobacteria bacterium]
MKAAKPPIHDTQLTLAGIGAPAPTDRLFFAVFPDPIAAVDITHLAQTLRHQYALHGNPVWKERLHVTLYLLGDYAGLPPALIAAATEAAERVEAAEFDVTFDKVSSFVGRSRNHPLILGGGAALEPLHAFRRHLGECLTVAGLGRLLGHQFIPHVTLLYDDKDLKSRAVEPISWRVREFALVHSLLGRTEHRVLERWTLRTVP